MASRSIKASPEGVKKIDIARTAKGLSVENLAERAGVSKSTAVKFVQGLSVDRSIFSNLCKSLKLNVEEIAEGYDLEKSSNDTQDSNKAVTDSEYTPIAFNRGGSRSSLANWLVANLIEIIQKSEVVSLLSQLFKVSISSNQLRADIESKKIDVEKQKLERELAASPTSDEAKENRQLESELKRLEIEERRLEIEKRKLELDRQKLEFEHQIQFNKLKQARETAALMQMLAEMAQRGAENSNAESITVEVDGIEIATYKEGKFLLSPNPNINITNTKKLENEDQS
jgi:transcriptional regulator with XRE-family HTH domain